jgi:hypothetical protein
MIKIRINKMKTFVVKTTNKLGPLMENILVENADAIIDDVYESPVSWSILISSDKTKKDLKNIIADYISEKDFIFC